VVTEQVFGLWEHNLLSFSYCRNLDVLSALDDHAAEQDKGLVPPAPCGVDVIPVFHGISGKRCQTLPGRPDLRDAFLIKAPLVFRDEGFQDTALVLQLQDCGFYGPPPCVAPALCGNRMPGWIFNGRARAQDKNATRCKCGAFFRQGEQCQVLDQRSTI
jgi:hypothetical protein